MKASGSRCHVGVSVILAMIAAALSLAAQSERSAQSIFLENLTWIEAEKALKDYDVALIALGARTKEHGPHLKLKTDYGPATTSPAAL